MTRLASIEAMAGMDMLCSDKTGTLTLNKMVIQVATPHPPANPPPVHLFDQRARAQGWWLWLSCWGTRDLHSQLAPRPPRKENSNPIRAGARQGG